MSTRNRSEKDFSTGSLVINEVVLEGRLPLRLVSKQKRAGFRTMDVLLLAVSRWRVCGTAQSYVVTGEVRPPSTPTTKLPLP